MEYNLHTLDNGLKIIHKQDKMAVSYCGMVMNVGSRDELLREQGMAHFVEHMLFKGTKKRRSGHIINKLENVGGELNAFTSKEETVVYAGVLNEHLEKAVDLIGDIVFNSTFPQKEFDKERVIILDEIQSYNDSPSELIYDEFEEILFKNHPIGHNILGSSDTLNEFSPKDAHDFVHRNYLPSQMVFFVLGDVKFEKIVRWAEKYFVSENNGVRAAERIKPVHSGNERLTTAKDTHQMHFMLGNQAYDLNHPDRLGLYLLNNILGGPGMNSLLNLSLREKHGLVYQVDSVYQPMTDTGMWSVYFGTDPENFTKCEKLVVAALKSLKDDKLKDAQLKKYKTQLLGQMALASENKENLAINLGKSMLRYGKVDDVETIRNLIAAISSDQLQRIANEVFDLSKSSVLIFK